MGKREGTAVFFCIHANLRSMFKTIMHFCVQYWPPIVRGHWSRDRDSEKQSKHVLKLFGFLRTPLI